MAREFNRKLILDDGSEYLGYGFGADCDRVCEIVFNTSMVGYQEIVSDPSYTDQAVVMTYPLIGNYGITAEDFESRKPSMGALIVCEYNDKPSNFRSTQSLFEVLDDYDIPGIEINDTRMLTRKIRDEGSRRVLITNIGTTVEEGLNIIKNTPINADLVSRVSCKKKWFSRIPGHIFNIVAIDCGIKHSFIKMLNSLNCNVTVVPYNATVEEIMSLKPDGIFVSNGPGNPEDVPEVVELIKKLKGKLPVFGASLGLGLIAIAYGGKISKLKFGHRSANHPVKNLRTGKIEIVAQNHSYIVDADSLKNTDLEITHINVLDNTVEGVCCEKDKIFATQYHPSCAEGPRGNENPIWKFIDSVKEEKFNA